MQRSNLDSLPAKHAGSSAAATSASKAESPGRSSHTHEYRVDHSAAGVTLLELVIASVLVLILAYLVMTLSKSGVDAQDYSRRMGRVTEVTQDLTESMREDVQASVRIFSNNLIGNDYLDWIEVAGLPVPIDTTRLPTIDEDGVFEPEASGGTETGNSLLLARYAWSDEFLTTSSRSYRVDVYRFVFMYLTEVGTGVRVADADGLDLVHVVSEPMADGNQLDNIADPTDRAEVLEHLRVGSADASGRTHDPITLIWKVGEDPLTVDTLRQILPGGALSSVPVAPRDPAGWNIVPDARRTQTGVLEFRHHSIATIYAPGICGVGRFGIVSTTDDGFPHGFEIQAVGPSSARQILANVSVVSNREGRLAFHRSQIVVDARDL